MAHGAFTRFNEAVQAGGLFAKVTFASGVFALLAALGYGSFLHHGHEALGNLVGRDFVNTWMGARAALGGRVTDLFDFPTYLHWLTQTLGPLPEHNWSYPPHILLFIWPLGYLPYFAAWAVWSLAGLALYLVVASADDRSPAGVAFLAVAPAVMVNLLSGQNGFFTAVLLILAVRYVDKRPILAGLCLGVLTIKPQLGLLFPLALLLSGRWRCFASAAVTTLLLAVATAAVFGAGIWSAYIDRALPVQQHILGYATGTPMLMMPSAFMNARLWGASPGMAWLVQAPFTLLAVAAVAWTFSRRRDPDLSFAVLITAGFVASPYVFGYDMVIFGWLIARLRPYLTDTRDTRLALAVWTLPVTMMVLALCRLPLAAPIIAAFLLRLVWLLRRQTACAVQPA